LALLPLGGVFSFIIENRVAKKGRILPCLSKRKAHLPSCGRGAWRIAAKVLKRCRAIFKKMARARYILRKAFAAKRILWYTEGSDKKRGD
jgi:hypothetical protein